MVLHLAVNSRSKRRHGAGLDWRAEDTLTVKEGFWPIFFK